MPSDEDIPGEHEFCRKAHVWSPTTEVDLSKGPGFAAAAKTSSTTASAHAQVVNTLSETEHISPSQAHAKKMSSVRQRGPRMNVGVALERRVQENDQL
jgi:hypothetical protein